MSIIYGSILIVSSFLIFLIELVTAKIVLPYFGGSPSVWTTCMMLYQVLLLAGYLLAHFLIKRNTIPLQVALYLGMIFFFPIHISTGLLGDINHNPTLYLVLMLLQIIGFPFLVLSTTSSIMQKWYAKTYEKEDKDPYFLYGLSNAGSFLALILYPLLIEPNLTVKGQNVILTVGSSILFVGAFYAAYRLNFGKNVSLVEIKDSPITKKSTKIQSDEFGLAKICKLLFLAFIASGMMVSLTSFLSNDIAISPNPLFWSMPLSIYLLTMIIAFSKKTFIKLEYIEKIIPLSIVFLAASFIFGYKLDVKLIVIVNFIALFLVGLLCHSIIFKERPSSKFLTKFYIYFSLGGALGGIFNSLVAPLIFKEAYEYKIFIIFACLTIPYAYSKPFISNFKIGLIASFVIGLILAPIVYDKGIDYVIASLVLIFTITVLNLNPKPLVYAIMIMFAFIYQFIDDGKYDYLYLDRDFFGVYKVLEDKDWKIHKLYNGKINHGAQYYDKETRFVPTAYYNTNGPLGSFFNLTYDMNENWDVGVVGLGVGGILAYKKESQKYTYFEISDKIIEIAKNKKIFTYVDHYKPDIILGDARLSMKKIKDHKFDLLILDAYSADLIPVHLLTKEAFEIYFDKIKEDGTILLHISNRVYDLRPVLLSQAKYSNLDLYIYDYYENEENVTSYETGSSWAILTKNKKLENVVLTINKWERVAKNEKSVFWTDDYASVFNIIK